MNEIIKHAQQTFLAMKDPYHSVERVYPQAIHALEKHDDIHYIGMKNAVQIPLRRWTGAVSMEGQLICS